MHSLAGLVVGSGVAGGALQKCTKVMRSSISVKACANEAVTYDPAETLENDVSGKMKSISDTLEPIQERNFGAEMLSSASSGTTSFVPGMRR